MSYKSSGYSKSKGNRRFPPSSKPEKLVDILPSLSQTLDLENTVRRLSVMSIFEGLLDPVYQGHVKPIKLDKQGDKTLLLVGVQETTMASALQMETPRLLAALNTYTPQTGLHIDQLRIVIR